ncbi:hypothetical protein IWW57_004672 [Coemansia sp. S610]|nr:hypothetical protein IWW57_004672 [Coemansia sp. S610]
MACLRPPAIRNCLVNGVAGLFGDEMALFRGNAGTLEYVKLTLTRELAKDLLRHNAFAPTSHPKLQCVIIRMPSSCEIGSDDLTAYPEYLQLAGDIAPDAAIREIDLWVFRPSTPLAFSLFGKLTYLQVLVPHGLRLSVWDAMALFKSLPLLSDYHAEAPRLNPLPNGINENMLVDCVRSNYSPMALRFRYWHAGSPYERSMREFAVPFLLLALACPNFDFVDVAPGKWDLLTKALEEAIGKAPYNTYAPRLQRLLPRGPK